MSSVCKLLALFSLAVSLYAQGTTSRLLGLVQDSSGALVAGATVSLSNEATSVGFTLKTTEAGTYVFDSIQPGTYSLIVEAPGFKKFTAKGNKVTIGQPTTVNVTLQVGTLTEVVEVSGAAEVVQTSTSGNFGNVIESQTIKDLPIVGTRGRNPLDLLLIQPGINSGANTGGGFHIHGARDRAFNFTLDGIDVNESSAGGSNFSPLRTNPDMLDQFRTLTGNFTADSGRNSGGQVAMTTKSGTNELHGSGFWFYRTPRFNANEWENNLDAIGKRQFVQHIYGGSLGGPIVKNKTFFFGNVQILRALETAIVTRTVYTQQMRQGIYRFNTAGRNLPAGVAGATVDRSGNPVNPAAIGSYNIFSSDPQRQGADRTIAALIAATPLPNRFDQGDGLNTAGFVFTAPQNERQHDLVFKVDHILDEKNTIYARYAFGQQNTNCDRVNGGQPLFPGSTCLVDTFRTPRNLAVNWRSNPSPNVTNEFVIGFNQFEFLFNQPLASLSTPSISGPVTTLSDFSFGNNRRVRTAQIVDNVSILRGPHTFKFGINFRLQRQDDDRGSVGGLNANPSINFSTVVNPVDPASFGIPSAVNTQFDLATLQSHVNFLLGRVGTYSQGFVNNNNRFTAGRFLFTTDYPEYDFYFQDTWKLRKNFTLDLGLRWEMKPAPSNPDNRIRRPEQALVAGGAPTQTAAWTAGQLYRDDYLNLGPSVGFAWDPFGDGKTSIRSNYRIAYDRVPTFLFASTLFPNMPGEAIGVVDQSFGQSGGRLANLPALAAPTTLPSSLAQPAAFGLNSNTVVDPNFEMATTQQWAFSIERELFKGTVVEATYFGRRGYNLMGAYNANQTEILRNGFLDGFNTIKAGGESATINRALSADSRIRAGETASQMIRRLFPADLANNNVGGLASGFATRIQGTRNVTDLSGAGPNFFIPFTQFGTLVVIDSNDFSTYNGLELTVRKNLSRNMTFNVNYTLSKSLDTRSFDPNFTTAASGAAQSASSSPFDIYNRRLNYARSDFDRTHQFKASGSWTLPFGKGERFGANLPTALDYLVGGWRLAPILTWSSGRPFTVFATNTFSNFIASPADCNGCSRNFGQVFDDAAQGLKFYFNADERSKFAIPAPGQLGNTGRNFFEGHRQFNFDMSMAKTIKYRERYGLEIRADGTNLTNTPTFGFPTATVTSAIFGRIRNTVISSSRKIQLGMRITF